MILEGRFAVPAPQQRVWEAIWDVPTLASWVPGCTSAEKIDDATYRVHLEQQISMFKAAFDLLLRVVETEPPNRVVLKGQGEDKRMGSNLQIESEVWLTADDPGSTMLHYRHDLSVFGRLGALGFPMIQRKAKEAEAEFARRARKSLEEEKA
jgi:carbon monoxide dehydrogenase subunit G